MTWFFNPTFQSFLGYTLLTLMACAVIGAVLWRIGKDDKPKEIPTLPKGYAKHAPHVEKKQIPLQNKVMLDDGLAKLKQKKESELTVDNVKDELELKGDGDV